MYIKIFILFIAFLSSPGFSSNHCDSWFSDLKIKPNHSGCVLKCASSTTDMSSFDCPNNCERLCNQQVKCKPSNKAKKLLKETLIFPKDNKTIATHKFTKEEIEKLQKTLEKINPQLLSELKGVVKLSPPSPLDIGNYSQYLDKYIILYPKAFQKNLLPYVIHELGHHLHEVTAKQLFKNYSNSMKWKNHSRPGKFLSADSKRSPTEDFATNFEAYLMHPESLKTTAPNAFQWMKSNFKNKFKLKDCDHE